MWKKGKKHNNLLTYTSKCQWNTIYVEVFNHNFALFAEKLFKSNWQKFSIMRGNQVWASAADENHWTFFTLIVSLKLCVTRQIYFITLSLLLFHTNQSLWLMRPFSYLFNTLHFSFNITWVYKVTTFCESVY